MNTYQSKFNNWLKYSNQTLNWFSTDTYDLYQHNLVHKKELMESNNLTHLNITYKFNSEGFRCEEFTDKPNIMFLGGSITQGIGLPNNLNYPNIVAKELKLECWNLALQGKSTDTMFRIAYHFIKKLKPKIVVCDYSLGDRFELLDIDECIDFIRGSTYPEKFYNEYFKVYRTTPENIFLNTLKNSKAIEYICYEEKIKCIDVKKLDIVQLNGTTHSWARDLLHPGVKYHYSAATAILKAIA